MSRGWPGSRFASLFLLAACGPSGGAGEPTGTESGSNTSGEPGETSETTGGTPSVCDGPWTLSFDAWRGRKASSGSTYWYTLDWTDTGFVVDPCAPYLTFEIADDQVVSRRLTWRAYPGEEDPGCLETEGWTEDGASVGSHEGFAPPRTMEQLYDECCTDILGADPSQYEVQFQVDDRGLLAQCTWWPTGCDDGCGAGPDGHGIRLTELEFGSPGPG